jgi:hypothetical protein
MIMPYLLSKNTESNLLIDKTGESIYYRHYPIKYNQRAIVIAKSSNNEYAASLDEYKNIHIIYKNSTNSLVHLYETNNKFEIVNLLDDYNNTYQISNIRYLYYKKNYLFYCAYNPYERTSDLIFHPFMQNEKTEPQSLISVPSLNTPYECIIENNTIYLLCQVLNDAGSYELNLYKYNISNSSWDDFETLTTSIIPFLDYNICINYAKIYVTYVKKDMNKNIMYYIFKENNWSLPIEIYTSNNFISPIIFSYNNIMWINWKENNKLMYSLSCNDGVTFTKASLCSAQSKEARPYYFYGYNNNNLIGNKFYGFINKYPIFAVLSQIDTDNILLSSQNNFEIKSIINNFTSKEMYNSIKLKKELEEQKKVQENITKQYDGLAKMAKELQSQAKMWKSKYTQAEQETKKLKKKLRKTYVIESEKAKIPKTKNTLPTSNAKKTPLQDISASSSTNEIDDTDNTIK